MKTISRDDDVPEYFFQAFGGSSDHPNDFMVPFQDLDTLG
jgi:hypothetical protein